MKQGERLEDPVEYSCPHLESLPYSYTYSKALYTIVIVTVLRPTVKQFTAIAEYNTVFSIRHLDHVSIYMLLVQL